MTARTIAVCVSFFESRKLTATMIFPVAHLGSRPEFMSVSTIASLRAGCRKDRGEQTSGGCRPQGRGRASPCFILTLTGEHGNRPGFIRPQDSRSHSLDLKNVVLHRIWAFTASHSSRNRRTRYRVSGRRVRKSRMPSAHARAASSAGGCCSPAIGGSGANAIHGRPV